MTMRRAWLGMVGAAMAAGGMWVASFGYAADPATDKAPAASPAKKKIVFLAGRPSHGPGQHEHNAGCRILADELQRQSPNIEVVVHRNEWPKDPAVLEGAAAVVIYCDGGGGHLVIPKQDECDKLMKQGVGLACFHYGVEVPAGKTGDYFLDWIGGYFEANWSVNPHWKAKFEKLPDHPIARGVKPFEIQDEWYYHMRFRPEMKGVTPILVAVPPESTLSRPDGPHSGNPHVRKTVGQPQVLAWAAERPDGGRGFGFTGGHFHNNWGDENFRRTAINALLWISKEEIPADGAKLSSFGKEQLEANLDPKGKK